jgi:hypothetical protein
VTDLETATTNDLVTELKRRHNTILVLCQRDARNDPVSKEIWWDFQGDDLQLIGMLRLAESLTKHRFVTEAEEQADDDD